MDIRLYTIDTTSNNSGTIVPSNLMGVSVLSAPPASGIEVLANKVAKFMLTAKGTDALDQSYGSTLPSVRVMDQRMMARVQMDLILDLENCTEFIIQNEDAYTEKKLRNISLVRLQYDPIVSKEELQVFIQIFTTSGESALLEIPTWMQA